MKYAVTAATGNLGQAAVKELNKLAGAENVIVIARNTDKAAKLFPNNEVRQGDYEDKSSMINTFNGIDHVLFISSQPGGKVDRATAHANVVDALKKNNIKFVAYTSFPDAQNSTAALATDHRLTENAIKEAGIDHSFLRNNWYLENEIGFLQSGAASCDALYWANNKAGWALERDYAEGAAKVITSEDPREVYEFAGKTRTYDELGKALQESTGNDFTIKQISHDDYVKSLEKAGLDTPTAELFASFQDPINSGNLNKESNDLEEVLGHPVTPLVDAIKEVLAR